MNESLYRRVFIRSELNKTRKRKALLITLVLWGILAVLALCIQTAYAGEREDTLEGIRIHAENIKKELVVMQFGLSQKAIVSAYNAEEAQTDSTPFQMANGKRVHERAVANNCHPFGTKVLINGKIYTVEDRMNKRYSCSHWDVFMWDKQEAIKFGRQSLEVVIL